MPPAGKPRRFPAGGSHIEIARKEAALHMRIPLGLLDALKARAASKGIPYTRYVRMLIEADIARAG
ncbi:hypothetical protein EHV23_05900 [Lautropia dentalis]|jgi:hypothetical protein|uniref:Uncharacterized protein n=1 Tax=Lautropia dentalis TaxID=2490857 RepID=A0A426FSK4_9BURK|nr:CopG family antitoxin [Lautropia dentalis]RRN45683.1 hypothetical protein EHV23_05900 [Lautropia dentalis]